MGRVVAFVLAGGVGKRLSLLSRYRAKPAVPFGGRYRIIDFTLTNCLRSGIDDVYVFTQYISRSLVRHIGIGKPWDLDRMTGGLHVLHPHLGYQAVDWYRGTADALFQNLPLLRRLDADRILILSGDHVYRMDYREFLDFHHAAGKPASLGVVKVPSNLVSEFGIATLDGRGNIAAFEEKPKRSKSTLASMGIYIFERQFLISLLKTLEGKHDALDFGKHVIPHLVSRRQVSAFRYDGYWLDIGTIKSYYLASLDLLAHKPRLKLYSRRAPILSTPDDRPPFIVTGKAALRNSLVCNGCVIDGAVHSSILSPGVRVERGAKIVDSIVFDDCVIGRGAVVERAIMDKKCIIGARARIGIGDASIPNRLQPDYIDSGITLLGKGTVVPPRVHIGTNCLVGGSLDGGAIPEADIEDGGYYVAGEERL